jgi:RimJ/RimL family protein N-acetyltransferase
VYTIRRTDNEALVRKLHTRVFPSDAFYESKSNVYWLLTCNGEPVGFCQATAWSGKVLFLSRSGILPEHRGKNLQIRLIRARVRYAKSNGFKKVVTYADANNPASANNLAKAGFLIYRPQASFGTASSIYFLKELDT